MRLAYTSIVIAMALTYSAPSFAQECAQNYLDSKLYIKTCEGVVHQPHGDAGFTFTTSSTRRRSAPGGVDIYDSCVKNTSGRALSARWLSAHIPSVTIPNGCAFDKPRADNYLKKGDSAADFKDTCIQFGNRWQFEDDARYLPTPSEIRNGFHDLNCAGQSAAAPVDKKTDDSSSFFDFLRATKEFLWQSATVFNADSSDQTQKLVAFVVDTRFTLTSDETYNYKIDYFFKELDPGAFELFSGFEVSPPESMLNFFKNNGWNPELSNIRAREHKSFEITLPYGSNMELTEEEVDLKGLGESKEIHQGVFVPVLK